MLRTIRFFALLALFTPLVFLTGCGDTDPVSGPPQAEEVPVFPRSGTVGRLEAPDLDLQPGEAPVELPELDATVQPVDLCELYPGLCGETCLEDDPSDLGPSKDRKGFGFSLDGCGNITELRIVSGNLAFDGDLAVAAAVTPGSLGTDPGCREVTVTIPGRPAIPPVPPVRNPFTGEIIVPGRPGRPAVPLREVTYRTPEGCSPLRDPSVEIERPTLDGLSFRTSHRVQGNLVLEAAGSGEVELRFPIPKVAKSVTAITSTDHRQEGELAYRVGAGVGLYGVVRGRLTESGAQLDFTIDESYETTHSWSPPSGWQGSTLPTITEMSSKSRFPVPDTLEIAYGIQPAIGVYMEPWPREELGVLPAQPGYAADLGLWTLRYFDNVFTLNTRGTLKNDSGAGLEIGLYGGVEYLVPGEEPSCDADNWSACEIADFYKQIDCCEADFYDQYGVGQLQFATTTTGEEIDHDPDGYDVTWARAKTTPEPWVDSVLTRTLPTNGDAYYPGGGLSPDELFTTIYGVVGAAHCAEYYSDLAISLVSQVGGILVPELRRQGWGIPLYTKIVGCQNFPADYDLLLSGFAVNCTLDGPNPRQVALEPSIRPAELELPPSERSGVAGPTQVPIEVHCRPLVGDVNVLATTFGEDHDVDGYALTADDEVKGVVEGRVSATGEVLLEELRVGEHTLEIGDVAFNCALRGPASRPVEVEFEAVTDAVVELDCEPVYEALSGTVEAMVEDGAIRSKEIGKSLSAKIDAAGRARDRGNVRAARGPMRGLEKQVRALAGRQITQEAAELLLEHVEYIRENEFFAS